MIGPDDVLEFWFGDGDRDDVATSSARTPLWFGHADATDDEIRRKFGDALAAAAAGQLDGWAATPRGRLALVILLDQFSRNAYRGTPAMFAQDERALQHARAAVDAGEDRTLALLERLFMYLPFEHAEDLDDQRRCVALFTRLRDEAPEAFAASAANYLDYAQKHLDIIERFGRFPHRNATLGRQSTPEELEFLTRPGSSF